MELNQSKNSADVPLGRFADIQQASERRSAELRETVERVQDARSEREESAEALKRRNAETDRIDLSEAARAFSQPVAEDSARQSRIDELRAAAEDGSLFDSDRLARAAERLLGAE